MTKRGTEFWTNGAVPIIGPEVLISIVASAADAALVLSPDYKVVSVMVNPNTSGLAQLDKWYGKDFLDGLNVESVPKFKDRVEVLRKGGEHRISLELNHNMPDGDEMPMQYSMFRIGTDGSTLLLGRDLRPIAQLQQQLIESQTVLERDYEIQREIETRLRVVMESSSDAIVFASLVTGRIISVNQGACDLLGQKRDALMSAGFAEQFAGARSETIERLTQAGSEGVSQPVDLTVKRNDMTVTAMPVVFRAAGERMLMMRLGLPEESRQVRDSHTDILQGMFQNSADGIVFVDDQGVIQTANDAFLGLCDATDLPRVVGRSLADFLERGTLDLRLLVDNASRTGRLRQFSTRLKSELDSTVPVEISATSVGPAGGNILALTIRDTNRGDSQRQSDKSTSDKHARNVSELVGSAPLKEIVSETTDVIEKMCIETAVEMTRNNRVAAAEMLGLSRQSLYVKLRKFGLLNDENAN